LMGCPKESLFQSDMIKTWPEAKANVDPKVWAILRLKEGLTRLELLELLERLERLETPDLQWVLHPADAPHWRLNSESLRTLVKWTTYGHRWEGGPITAGCHCSMRIR
jgi:hypothetical protein